MDNASVMRGQAFLDEQAAALGAKPSAKSRTGKNKNDPTHPALSSQSITYSYTLDDGTCTSYTANVPFLHDIDEEGELTLIESRVAERLADCLRGHFAFSREGSRWYAFTGTHWHAVQAGVLDELVTRMMYAGAIEGFAARRVPAILSLLAKGLLPLPEQRDSRLLPFTNGLLDLETRELTPTTPDNALIWCLPYAYDPHADCFSVKAWLLRAVDDDAETLEFLRAWLAALLTGRADLQKFLHLFGPGGTGKGVFTRLAELLIGQHNATVTDLRNLEQNRFETATLYGKRLVSITDTSKYGGSVDVFKALTGQDSLRLERKHQQQGATFRFGGMVLLASNEALQTTDYTSALERRRLTVEFKRLVTDEERADWNARGGEDAILHSEIAGVVNWCLALSRDEVTQRLTCQPQRVAQANREALRNGNPIADWLIESVIPQPGASTQVGDHRPIYESGRTRYEYADVRLYPNYLQWCQRTKREALALRRFSGLAVDMARSLGVDVLKLRGSTGVCIKGLRLRGEDETPHDWLGRVGSDAGSVGSVQDSSEKTPYNPLIVQEMKEVKDNSNFYLHTGGDSPPKSLPAASPASIDLSPAPVARPTPEPRYARVQVLREEPEPRIVTARTWRASKAGPLADRLAEAAGLDADDMVAGRLSESDFSAIGEAVPALAAQLDDGGKARLTELVALIDAAAQRPEPEPPLSPTALKLERFLAAKPDGLEIDEILQQTRLSKGAVADALHELERVGLVRNTNARWTANHGEVQP